jgi:hypothetical protein
MVMALVNREFTYRRSIKVSSGDLALAKNGQKICTTRVGVAKVDANLIDLSDGKETLRVRILSIETKPYKDLTAEHARWEGFATLEELQADLAKYYPKIDREQPVTIIKFGVGPS